MPSLMSFLLLFLSALLSSSLPAFAVQTPPASGPDQQLCYWHEYNLVNQTLDNGTVLTDIPQFVCDESTNYFQDQLSFTIDFANQTIKNVDFSNTFVDLTLDVSGEDFNARFIVCGCPLPPDSDTKNASVFTNPKNIFVPDGPAIHLVSELPLNYNPIAYIDSKDFKYNANVRSAVDRNEITEISLGSWYNWTALTEAGDVSAALINIFSYSTAQKNATSANFTGALLPLSEAIETNPLARAEWVKVVGLLFYQTNFSNILFDNIVKNYQEVRDKATEATRLPTVVFNYPFGSEADDGSVTYNWTQPGSEDYVGRFIQDAYSNHRYLPTSTSATSGNLSSVWNDFKAADYLLNAASFPRSENLTDFFQSLNTNDAIRDMKDFASIRCGRLWSQDKRVNGSANDFFESGIVEPHTILKDFVSILHPELDFISDHEPVYMRNLPRGDVQIEDFEECPYAEFQQDPAEGSAYVDKTFIVTGLDMFQVQDAIEPDILPLLEAEISKLSVQFRFTERAVANVTETNLTVRRNLSSADAEAYNLTDSLLVALQNGLNVTVVETSSQIVQTVDDDGGNPDGDNPTGDNPTGDNPTGDNSDGGSPNDANQQGDDDDNGGGLSGGAIAGIVIAVLVVVGAVTFAYLRSRRKNAANEPLIRQGGDAGEFPGSS